jgi:hypothetical protein
MSGNLARRFGDRERQRLIKLLRLLGTGNAHEREVARSMMDALLREHGRAWADLIRLLAAGIAGSLRMHGASTAPTTAQRHSLAISGLCGLPAAAQCDGTGS